LWGTPERVAQFAAMTCRTLAVRIPCVSVGAFHRNDRQTGQRRQAATWTAPTLPNDLGGRGKGLTDTVASERARRLERWVGTAGILPAYARDLANIRRQAVELRVKNRRMLRQVRELQTQPTSWATVRGSSGSDVAARPPAV
jgi:hypothetical protein